MAFRSLAYGLLDKRPVCYPHHINMRTNASKSGIKIAERVFRLASIGCFQNHKTSIGNGRVWNHYWSRLWARQ